MLPNNAGVEEGYGAIARPAPTDTSKTRWLGGLCVAALLVVAAFGGPAAAATATAAAALRRSDDDGRRRSGETPVRQRTWSSAATGKSTHAVEEHVLWSERGFVQAAYAMWRYGVNGPKSGSTRAVDATTKIYHLKKDFEAAIVNREIGANALVFADLRYGLLDTSRSVEAIVGEHPSSQKYEHALMTGTTSLPAARSDPAALDVGCVQQFTPDLLLRAPLLRQLLAYPKPLKIVLASDLACGLQLPTTHHAVISANDGHFPDSTNNMKWWPFGYEAFAMQDNEKVGDLERALDAYQNDWAPLSERTFLVSTYATLADRKISRPPLLKAFRDAAFVRRLAGVDRTRKTSVVLADDDGHHIFGSDAIDHGSYLEDDVSPSSLFVICPAGDFWSSGREWSALMVGAIPVVDATYGSKPFAGCDDPARFYREGSADFPHRAPFVFVDDWTKLPEALIAFGAGDDAKMERRLEDLKAYRATLEAYMQDAVFGAPGPASTCATTDLSAAERARQDAAARAYYSPLGSTDWHATAERISCPDFATYFKRGRRPQSNAATYEQQRCSDGRDRRSAPAGTTASTTRRAKSPATSAKKPTRSRPTHTASTRPARRRWSSRSSAAPPKLLFVS